MSSQIVLQAENQQVLVLRKTNHPTLANKPADRLLYRSQISFKVMFEQVETLQDNVIDIRVKGKITKEDYESLYPVMEEHKNKYGKIRLLVEIDEFEWPDIMAMWEDIKMGFRYLNDIEKVALITETTWIEKISKRSGAVIPKIAVESFDHDERDQAIAWLQ